MKENYLITGATGFIGKLLVDKLLQDTDNRIYIFVRNRCKAEAMYNGYTDRLVFVDGDLRQPDIVENIRTLLPESIDYIIHCAATTESKKMIGAPVETADGIVIGTKHMLELAKDIKPKVFLYISSMEVYGSIKSGEKRITEDMLGLIDLSDIRSCYPMGKRMAELYCNCYYTEYGVPVKIARLAQVFGRGVLPTDNRVFAQFARAVINNQDIVLHTDGTSMGNYVDSEDATEALMFLLQNGDMGETYNIVNEENTMMIRDMAQMVATEIAEDKIKVIFDIPEENIHGYAAKTGLKLSGEKMRRLGWTPKTNLADMYRKLISDMTAKL